MYGPDSLTRVRELTEANSTGWFKFYKINVTGAIFYLAVWQCFKPVVLLLINVHGENAIGPEFDLLISHVSPSACVMQS